MYINIKSKYKKIFWLLIGFCLACMFTSNVKAWSDVSNFNFGNGITPATHNIVIEYSTRSNTLGYRFWAIPKTQNTIFYLNGSNESFPNHSYNSGIQVRENLNGSPLTGQCTWYWPNNDTSQPAQCAGTGGQVLSQQGYVVWTNSPIYNSVGTWFNPYVISFNLNGGTMWTNGNNSIPYSILDFENAFESSSSAIVFIKNHYLTNGNLTFNGWYYDSEFTQPFDIPYTCNNKNGVPCDYTEVEYLQFDGNSYIDTGLIPSNHTTEIKFDWLNYENDERLFGTDSQNSWAYYSFVAYQNSYYFGLDGSQGHGGTWSTGVHNLIYNGSNNLIQIDNNTLFTGSNITATSNLLLGRSASTSSFKGKIYYTKITDKTNNTLVRNLIPCFRNSDGVAGMYDTVNNVFYTNSGTGSISYPFYNISNNFSLYAQYNQSLPDYLSGYTKITLEPGKRYVMFSSSTITSGSVYIPIEDFNNYGSRISYFDKDIDTQPYTSYIQDFSPTPDGLYAKQNFDLSSYVGSDFIMFSKYIYLEGQDNITTSVWVPSEMYSSIVEVTPNNTGGSDFDFSYVDTNGDLQSDVISSSDLSQSSPLVSDLFTNFTTRDYGLSSIITAPIPLLQTLNNATCSTIELPLGMFGGVHDNKLILPCMAPIYSSMFGQFFTLYQTITTGFIAYYVGLAYFNKIKQLKDPDNNDIEVVDL